MRRHLSGPGDAPGRARGGLCPASSGQADARQSLDVACRPSPSEHVNPRGGRCRSMRQAERQRDRSGKLNVRALILLMVVVLAWGSMWPVNKALLAYMPPIWSVALRTYISTLTLF